jgi:hypothetical protein
VSIEAVNDVLCAEIEFRNTYRASGLDANRSYTCSALSLRRNRLMHILFVLIFITLFFLAGPASAQISMAHVTSCGPSAFPGTACTVPATGGGNLLVVAIQLWGNNSSITIAGVTDNAGNTYMEAGPARAINAFDNTVADIWYAKNSVPGATSVTITPSVSVASSTAVIWEFTGASTLDATSTLNSQPSGVTPSGASVTTSAAVEVIVSIVEVQNNVTSIASGNGFTNDSLTGSNGWAHLITSSPGTYSAQWNQTVAGTSASSTASFKASSVGALNACDLNQDGIVNVVDGQVAVNMYLGLMPCTANVVGVGICTTDVVNRVITAALGGTCVTVVPPAHSVTLNWIGSVSSNISGYNIYRSTTSGGPYGKLNSTLVPGTTYLDTTVVAGQTYYYVATAVDISNNESAFSTEAQAVVPTP